MTDSSESDDGATAEDETPRGASKPAELAGRDAGEEERREIPPDARDDEGRYHDKHDEAREVENPDQHRDEEEYD